MSKIYFDRTVPFYITDQASFEATPVDVPKRALKQAQALRELVDLTEQQILNSAGPESANQELAEFVSDGLGKIFKGK